MTRKRIKLITNPNADMGNAWRQASDLRSIVEERFDAEWAGTVYPTHAIDLAHQAAQNGFEMVIAVGGDGTIHEVINGLMQIPAERRPKLGIVPLGSGNDFAKNLGLHEKADEALVQLLNGEPHKFDIGSIEDERGRKEYWCNTINMGFGGSVAIYSHDLPVVRGFLMYLMAVVLTIVRHHDVLQVKLTLDDESIEDELMMLAVCNGAREGGGFWVAPAAQVDDGWLDYTAVRKVSRPMMVRMIPDFMKGSQERFHQINMGRVKRIEIESKQPLYLHTDGEIFAGFNNDIHHVKIEVVPQAIEIMMPKLDGSTA